MTVDKNDKSTLITQRVMTRIGADGLVPNPGVFNVLYAYYSASHPDIIHEVDALTVNKEPLTTTFCEQLYDRFLSSKGEKAFLEETAKRMQSVATEISAMVKSSGMAHREYNQTLQRQSDHLSSSNDLNQVKQLVIGLMDDTRRMIEHNHSLEDRLHQSSADLQQMREDMQSLRHEALTDTLTGIPNRKAFDIELKTRAGDALHRNRPLSMIMIDIDYFKIFNDTFGHQVGDQVLRLVAKTIGDLLKPTEILARYGGEEFAVVCSGLKLKEAEKLAEKIRERIATKDIINQSKNEKLGRLSVSLGVAQLQAGEPLTLLIDRADRALYKAKAAGRNNVVSIEYDAKLHADYGDIVIDVNR